MAKPVPVLPCSTHSEETQSTLDSCSEEGSVAHVCSYCFETKIRPRFQASAVLANWTGSFELRRSLPARPSSAAGLAVYTLKLLVHPAAANYF